MVALKVTSRLRTALSAIGGGIAALASHSWAAQPVEPYFNGVFPVQTPGSASGWTTQNAFPNLTFVDPIWLTEIPGTNELLMVGKSGKISRFANLTGTTQAEVTAVLDLASLLQISEDQGLYRLIFHPQFGQQSSPHTSDVFICYSYRPTAQSLPDKSMWRVSRFTWSHDSGTIDPASESVLIQQYDPHRWHNAGAMCFDNEGFLMITCGDGGGADDQLGQSQKINGGFFGGVLRIDVDNDPTKSHPIARQPQDPPGKPVSFPASFSQGYGIPDTNPWVGGQVLEEFYAIGLRSPHSASYDPVTGDLWTGDVGQFKYEELNRVTKGGNFQWPYMEGAVTGSKAKPATQALIGTEAAPFHAYGRGLGNCIIAGPRYRGAKWAMDLGGKVLYVDNVYGGVSSAQPNIPGVPVVQALTSISGSLYTGTSNICTDSSGEIYFLKLNGQNSSGGTIRKLAKTGSHPEPPSLLSATGLFTNTSTLTPSAAMVPYQVASELWSDGAVKKRWMVLPNDGTHDTAAEKITFSETGNWAFPAGSVFVKHFEIPIDQGNPSVLRRLETRVMVCMANGGKYGLTYKWNTAGTDAVLLSSGEDEVFEVTLQDGSTENRSWSYPSRNDCMQCHTDVTGQSLGLRTHQINRMVIHPNTGQPVNQLSLFASSGYIYSGYDPENLLKSKPLDDPTAPVEHRVRSYLDSNCSHCHQPGSSAPFFDARLQTPLRYQKLVNGIIKGQFNLGPEGRYIKPGDPALSAVHARLASNTPGVAMPPLGKHLVDQKAVDLIHNYISGLIPAEFEVEPVPTARYVRLTSLSSHGGNYMSVGELSILDGTGKPVPVSNLTIKSFTSEASVGNSLLAIDGNPNTYWMTQAGGTFPKQITLDLGSLREVGGFVYIPRQDSFTGLIASFETHSSTDGIDWTPMISGSLAGRSYQPQRFDSLIENRLARCEIAGPTGPVSSTFELNVAFDSAVIDFAAEDISVIRGKVLTLRGSGYSYVATVQAYSPEVLISVPENVVNSGLLGNRPSNTLSIVNTGEIMPVLRFEEVPEQVWGPFQMVLTTDRAIKDLYHAFSVTNGALASLFSDGPNRWRLVVIPSGGGDVTVAINDGTVFGTTNIPADGITTTIRHAVPKMAMEAEHGQITAGFAVVDDPAASNGSYLWVPEASRSGNNSRDPSLKVVFHMNVPDTGIYQLKGWVRSDHVSSNSFHLGIDGEASPARWRTNTGVGEIGSGLFHADLANSDGTPRFMELAAGDHVLELYAGDDGTRIDRLEIVPLRPHAAWVSDGKHAELPLWADLEFTADITGLEATDFIVGNGRQVTSITGSGRRYRITTNATYIGTALGLKENSVQDSMGRTNPASAAIMLNHIDTFEQWAVEHGVDTSPALDLVDTDGDGLGQLLEYAMGLDPNQPDVQSFNPADPASKGLPHVMTNQEADGRRRISVLIRKRKGGMILDFTVEFTSDFIYFDRQSTFWFPQSIDAQWESLSATDQNATGWEPSRFVRVKVQRR